MITFDDALQIWLKRFPRTEDWPPPGEIRETDDYWCIGFDRPMIGIRGMIIDRADGHFNDMGSGLTVDEWLYAHERGFKHWMYVLEVTAVRDTERTLDMFRKMGYRWMKEPVENPPFSQSFSWMGYRDLPQMFAADFFDWQITVQSCEDPACKAIGTVVYRSQKT